MEKYFHSVRLDEEKCRGCTNCIKRCPTEAIRVRDGKARITDLRCIDCGECIRICPSHAKYAITDPIERINLFKYKVALVAPSFFGQFKTKFSPNTILNGLLSVGFDAVFEVGIGAQVVTALTKEYLKKGERKKPLISSACPVIIRLIQVRFPNLLENIIPILPPVKIAEDLAREEAVKRTGLLAEDIGLFFITPCPAKVTFIRQPEGTVETGIDGAISMAEIYPKIIQNLDKISVEEPLVQGTGLGVGWSRAGGEVLALGSGKNTLAIDGIHNVISVLEEVDMGKLQDIDYIECVSCVGGCIGGVLTIENPFVARVKIRTLAEEMEQEDNVDYQAIMDRYLRGEFFFNKKFEPRPILKLDDNVVIAMQKLERLEQTLKNLPQLDCGACGSPHCRALAEDIVQGKAVETDCVFKLREEIARLSGTMLELAQKVPPAMGKKIDKR